MELLKTTMTYFIALEQGLLGQALANCLLGMSHRKERLRPLRQREREITFPKSLSEQVVKLGFEEWATPLQSLHLYLEHLKGSLSGSYITWDAPE